MEKENLIFAKKLIEDQIKIINLSDKNESGEIAYALFNNPIFCNVIIDVFHVDYYMCTKQEIVGDSFDRVRFTLNEMISKIENKINC